MIDTKQQPSQDEEHARERKPELESETLKDLTPLDEQADAAKGGPFTDGDRCDCQTM